MYLFGILVGYINFSSSITQRCCSIAVIVRSPDFNLRGLLESTTILMTNPSQPPLLSIPKQPKSKKLMSVDYRGMIPQGDNFVDQIFLHYLGLVWFYHAPDTCICSFKCIRNFYLYNFSRHRITSIEKERQGEIAPQSCEAQKFPPFARYAYIQADI